jgi:hypothetical protein
VPTQTTDHPTMETTAEAHELLLHRVVDSRELKRAARLRELLLYLGKRQREGAVNLREQEVGAAVFGRPEEYDTALDNIVRVNVSELRKRLAHYFQEEGAAEPLLIEIPRGGYLPVFVRRQVAEAVAPGPGPVDSPAAEVASAPVVLPRATEGRGFLTPLLAILLLCAGAACAVLQWQNVGLRTKLRPWTAEPALNAFWSQFFATGHEVDIVSADSSYALAGDLLHRTIPLDDYLDYKYKSYTGEPGVSAEQRDTINMVLDRNNGSVGDFQVAERILQLGGPSSTVKVASARSYTPESIKMNDIILIGSSESNPWVDLYKDRMNFFLEYDPVLHRSYVVNHAPQSGEPAIYTAADTHNTGYSVVAFLPNLSDHHNVLVIAGTDSQATRAAGDFITSGAGMEAIRQRLPVGRYPYIEVVLSSSRLVGTTLHTEIQAVRGHER